MKKGFDTMMLIVFMGLILAITFIVIYLSVQGSITGGDIDILGSLAKALGFAK